MTHGGYLPGRVPRGGITLSRSARLLSGFGGLGGRLGTILVPELIASGGQVFSGIHRGVTRPSSPTMSKLIILPQHLRSSVKSELMGDGGGRRSGTNPPSLVGTHPVSTGKLTCRFVV